MIMSQLTRSICHCVLLEKVLHLEKLYQVTVNIENLGVVFQNSKENERQVREAENKNSSKMFFVFVYLLNESVLLSDIKLILLSSIENVFSFTSTRKSSWIIK